MPVLVVICEGVLNKGGKDWLQIIGELVKMFIKGARSDCVRFFEHFLRFWFQKKAIAFRITLG